MYKTGFYALGLALLLTTVLGMDPYHPERTRRRESRILRDVADIENEDFWMQKGNEELARAKTVYSSINDNIAKNIIIFIGDGMSIPTVTAARFYKALRLNGKSETPVDLAWDAFPHSGFSKTYSVDGMVSDSAATASAMFSGVKTIHYTMGYDSSIRVQDADSAELANEVTTILDWAQEAEMATGFLTNTHLSHATPGALYAKTPYRFWECDTQIPVDDKKKVKDITLQMLERPAAVNADIILGGGKSSFVDYPQPKFTYAMRDFDYSSDYFECARSDSRNLTEEWKVAKPNRHYIETKQELKNLDPSKHAQVLGIFAYGHLPYEDQLNGTSSHPTVAEMTENAIKFLKKRGGDKGFFLMVEGGKIDHAHHGGKAVRALNEVLGLDRAVEKAVEMVDLTETLIIVTADHAHTFSMGGYPSRDADITTVDDEDDALDHKPYTILEYGNGPGFKDFKINKTATNDTYDSIIRPALPESNEYEYHQPSGIPLNSETHGGDDVGIWAIGPMSHYFHGVHQQNYIGHVMSLAGCIGPHKDDSRCANGRIASSASITSVGLLSLVPALLVSSKLV